MTPYPTRRGALLSGMALVATTDLVGCSLAPAGSPTTAPTPTTSTALWGVAKGIGQVALAALTVLDPPAAALVTSAISLVDGMIASGTADAATVTAQANAVILASAPHITAIANS